MITVDFYSGCGSLSVALSQVLSEPSLAVENWKPGANCYAFNFPNIPLIPYDLQAPVGIQMKLQELKPDMIVCNLSSADFSQHDAAKQNAVWERMEFLTQILMAVRPENFLYFCLSDLRSNEKYQKLQQSLRSEYGLTEAYLDVSLYGCPQFRSVLTCFGMRNTEDGFAQDLLTEYKEAQPVTVRTVLPYFPYQTYFYLSKPYPDTKSSLQKKRPRQAVFSVNAPAPAMRAESFPIPDPYWPHPKDAGKVTQDLHTLTFFERAAIQTFPDDFSWTGTGIDRGRMLGSSIPPAFAERMIRILLDSQKKKDLRLDLTEAEQIPEPEEAVAQTAEEEPEIQTEPVKEPKSGFWQEAMYGIKISEAEKEMEIQEKEIKDSEPEQTASTQKWFDHAPGNTLGDVSRNGRLLPDWKEREILQKKQAKHSAELNAPAKPVSLERKASLGNTVGDVNGNGVLESDARELGIENTVGDRNNNSILEPDPVELGTENTVGDLNQNGILESDPEEFSEARSGSPQEDDWQAGGGLWEEEEADYDPF